MTNHEIIYQRACQAFQSLRATEAYLKSKVSPEVYFNLEKQFPAAFARAAEIERLVTGNMPPDVAELLIKEWELIWFKMARHFKTPPE